MYTLVRRYIKTAIVFLALGLIIGEWMMARRELYDLYPSSYVVSAHTHAIFVGFVMMMILGVALWLFPRPDKEDTRYRPALVEGAYWLPAYQRVEAQVAVPLTGGGRSVFRVVSNFRDYALDAAPAPPEPLAAADSAAPNESGRAGAVAEADTMAAKPHRLSFAPRDSVERFGGWARPIGAETAEARRARPIDQARRAQQASPR